MTVPPSATHRVAVSLALAAALVVAGGDRAIAQPAQPEPAADSGLFERSGRRLVQLEVGIRGPRDAVDTLEADEFELTINGERIADIVVDRLCEARSMSPADADRTADDAADAADAAAIAAARGGASLLFYFDQAHLTMGGRARALDVARDLVRELVVDGARAMIVSSGAEVRTFAELTGDRDTLLEAFDRLEGDRRQWDTWSTYEPTRIEEVLREIEANNVSRAATIARRHMRDEQWRTERALQRFEMVLGTMADLDAPKAVLYFADTMRSKSGAHYMSFFGSSITRPGQAQQNSMIGAEASVHAAGHAVQSLIDSAGAHGLRFYTVQAEGLDADLAMSHSPGGAIGSGNRAGADPIPNRRRHADARDSLVALARETGGRAFLDGVRSSKIASRIRDDLSCVYILSFDAGLVAHDRALPVRVRVTRPKITPTARGSVLVPSEERLLTSRLLAAFAAPDAVDSDVSVRGALVPLGYVDGRYTALAQVVVPPSPLSTTSWDVGLSLVTRGTVRDDASGRVELRSPGVQVVLEATLELAPGRFELVGVAHERNANAISTSEVEGEWIDPDDLAVSISPIAVMQPAAGAFVRDGEVRRDGALVLHDGATASAARPTAVVSLVCRARRRSGSFRALRSLVGDTMVELEPIELELVDDRCAQVRDLLPAGSLGPGTFRYRLEIRDGEESIAEQEHSFAVAGDAARLR